MKHSDNTLLGNFLVTAAMPRPKVKLVGPFLLGLFPPQVLTGHTGSVLCLQYDERVIISGSSDSTVRVWDVNTGDMTNTLIHHCEAVLHLRFNNGMMVTCSKVSPGKDFTLRRISYMILVFFILSPTLV